MKRLVLLIGIVAVLGAITALTAPPTKAVTDDGPSSYLCWNSEMVSPVAYADSVADVMWQTGKYLEPQAVLGNVTGGTNVGAYHLVCNAASTLKVTELGLGGSGEVYGAEAMVAYHHDHLLTTNDLNVYHIYK